MKLDKKKTLPMLIIAAVVGGSAVPLLQQAWAQNDARPAAPAPTAPAAAATPAAAPKKVPPETVVLTIGDEKITAAQFDEFLTGLPAQYQQMAEGDPTVRRMIADKFIEVRLLAAEARKRGIDQTPKYKNQLRMIEDQVLAQELNGSLVTDKAIEDYLAEHKNEYVTARHILISTKPTDPSGAQKARTEDEAKKKADDVRARLTKGEDFAAVAKAESDDPGSKDTGGVYTFPKGQMVKEFEETAFGLKEGELSQPVKTAFGYHLIQRQPADLKEIRPQLQQQIGPKKMEELVAGLKKGASTKLNTAYFGEPAAVPPAGATPGAPAGATPPAPAEQPKQ